jgi:hypothetical protein
VQNLQTIGNVISDVVDNIFQLNPLYLLFIQFLTEGIAHFHVPHYCIVVDSHIDGIQIDCWPNFEERAQLSYRRFYHYILHLHFFPSDDLLLNHKVALTDLRLEYLRKACVPTVDIPNVVENYTLVNIEKIDDYLESADIDFVCGGLAFHKLYL